MIKEEKSMNDSKEEYVDVSKVTKAFDGYPLITTRIPSSKKKRRVKRIEKSVKEDSRMILVRQRCDGDTVEYKTMEITLKHVLLINGTNPREKFKLATLNKCVMGGNPMGDSDTTRETTKSPRATPRTSRATS
ncbi:unnamed protein product [Cochlearia groenlandica]